MLRHIDQPDAGFDELFDADHEPLQDQPADGATFGAAFFGWLVASALAVLIGALIAASGTALGRDRIHDWTVTHANASALLGAGLVVVAVTISEYAGGYVGGRMVHARGGTQGFAVWLLGTIAAAATSAAAYFTGRHHDLISRLDIPAWITTPATNHPRAGLIAALVVVVAALLAAIAGGISGNRYHRRLDPPSR